MAVDPLVEAALAATESALNGLLRRGSPATLEAMGDIAGQCIAIELNDLGLRVHVQFGRHGVALSRQAPSRVATTIEGTLSALGRLAGRTGLPDDVRITGDVELAQRLQRLSESAEIDWEEVLSGALGDPLAHAIVRRLSRARHRMLEALGRLEEDLSDYLLEELAVTPHRDEIDSFSDEVDELRAAVDRCQARIALVERRLGDPG